MNVSVCMATYNGELFLKQQIDSILTQLEIEDELIISDDNSIDGTLDIIYNYQDKRIKLFINETNLGVNRNFEIAISKSINEIIILADQDDIWSLNRLEIFKQSFKKNIVLVSTNFDHIDRNENLIEFQFSKLKSGDSKRYISNIFRIFLGRANYYGCAMAFRRKFLDIILPFPRNIESHDLYIAMAANVYGSNLHLDDITLTRRIHGNNLSVVNRNVFYKVLTRFIFMQHLLLLTYRVIRYNLSIFFKK